MTPDVHRPGDATDTVDLDGIASIDAAYRYRLSADERPSVGIVTAVAEYLHGGPDGLDLRERLYERVDPDGLDRLFRDGDVGVVAFCFNGCKVTVTSDDEVLVTDSTDDA